MNNNYPDQRSKVEKKIYDVPFLSIKSVVLFRVLV